MVATISNVWRGVGVADKLSNSCRELFTDAAVALRVASSPGRCLRGRWGSMCDVEGRITEVLPELGATLEHTFGPMNRRAAKRKQNVPGDDDDDDAEAAN